MAAVKRLKQDIYIYIHVYFSFEDIDNHLGLNLKFHSRNIFECFNCLNIARSNTTF